MPVDDETDGVTPGPRTAVAGETDGHPAIADPIDSSHADREFGEGSIRRAFNTLADNGPVARLADVETAAPFYAVPTDDEPDGWRVSE